MNDDNIKENQMMTSVNFTQIKHSNLSDEYDQEKFSMRDSHSGIHNKSYHILDDIIEMKKKISIQEETIKEFESYLVMLMNVVERSGGGGYTSQIRKVKI